MRRGYVLTAEARQAIADRRRRELDVANGPMGLWDKALGGHLAAEFAKDYTPGEAGMNSMTTLRDALLQHAAKGAALVQAVQPWRPDPNKPGQALDGSDLDRHPPEYRNRMLKQAQSAIRNHDAEAMRVIDPLIAEAEREPMRKLQLGTRLDAAHTGEVQLMVEQFRGVTRQEQAELQTLALAALERGDLTEALQRKRAAEVLRVGTPELDERLTVADPVRAAGRAQLDKLKGWVHAAQADAARLHVAAGIADSTEQIGHLTWAQEHGFDPDGRASYVEATLAGE